MKKKKNLSYRAMVARAVALGLGLWLMITGVLTWAVAEDMFRQIDMMTELWVKRMSTGRDIVKPDRYAGLPGAMEAELIENLGHPYVYFRLDSLFPFVLDQRPQFISSHDWLWGKWDLVHGYDFSVVYYDENAEVLMTSGNRMTFTYIDEESWTASAFEPQGVAWVDLDAIPDAANIMEGYLGNYYISMIHADEFLPVIRLTGWFEGSEFHPVTLERGWYTGSPSAGRDIRNMRIYDQRGKVDWETLLTAPADPSQKLVTLYGWNVGGSSGYQHKPVQINDKEYQNLTELCLSEGVDRQQWRGLWQSVTTARTRGEDGYGKFGYSLTVRCYPLQYAMLRLIPTYLVTLAVMVLIVLVVIWLIRRNVIDPLEARVGDTRKELSQVQSEKQSLNTALENAKALDLERKQLISNITHELKTPLAVIHGYAEGLQTGIAPEKQEQYIQIILSETERMDALVMQMLELSRLEAGKVKLNMEVFSLSGMIRSVAEKFLPLMEEKQLNLRLELEDDTDMYGDINRMEQVIANYMSNAVKYTPEGGQILIKVTQSKHGIFFGITNTASHLPDEVLNRVYDSFYRQDTSRTEKNTGLGLAIVKGIMTLHGYQCYVINSLLDGQEAVEFGFFPQSQ